MLWFCRHLKRERVKSSLPNIVTRKHEAANSDQRFSIFLFFFFLFLATYLNRLDPAGDYVTNNDKSANRSSDRPHTVGPCTRDSCLSSRALRAPTLNAYRRGNVTTALRRDPAFAGDKRQKKKKKKCATSNRARRPPKVKRKRRMCAPLARVPRHSRLILIA